MNTTKDSKGPSCPPPPGSRNPRLILSGLDDHRLKRSWAGDVVELKHNGKHEVIVRCHARTQREMRELKQYLAERVREYFSNA